MFKKIKDEFTTSLVSSLLTKYEAEELDAGKRLISVVAGVYMLQKGIRKIRKHHIVAVEEIVLGSILLYSAASGLHKKIIKQPVQPSDIRKNQIQGNDPRSDVPAFV
ncbi:hypothetical protein [Pedobacter africanus]|uniref:Uncharacterized protein n=1 Tax=Pedobacter africanus TaxID=151894 RepID=A0A1W2DJT1_9SPHI|nr:hypothetical protein [Pedobacter africanus]SMC97780.1 hypothetical protein SAMN04488524_3912 [Pedobacter africanus]